MEKREGRFVTVSYDIKTTKEMDIFVYDDVLEKLHHPQTWADDGIFFRYEEALTDHVENYIKESFRIDGKQY